MESVNVDSLRLFHPFKDISGQSNKSKALFPARRKSKKISKAKSEPHPPSEPLEKFIPKDISKISELAQGDMLVILNPSDYFEPLSVMKLISWDGDGYIIAQFYGKFNFEWYVDRRIAKQKYYPCWYQPSDTQFYYRQTPMHRSHPPFTNELAQEHVFKIENIITFGFHLQKNLRLPREVAKLSLNAWRNMTFEPDASGTATFEAKDSDMQDLE